MQKMLVLMCFLITLAACSSGGKGGGPTKSEVPAKTTSSAISVNAGADRVVTVGDEVSLSTDVQVVNVVGRDIIPGSTVTITSSSGDFEVTGSSTNLSAITKLSWKRIEGPAFSITRSDYTSGNFKFTAPYIDTADSVDIVYQLTITNAAGSSASDTVKITVKRAPDSSSSGANTPVLSGAPLILTPEGELMDTASLPSPLSAVTEPLVHHPEFAVDAAVGFYKFGVTHVISGAGDVEDCPIRGTVTCPYFDRIRISPDGQISISKWAYYPVQKKWVALNGKRLALKFASSDITFDGASWSTALTYSDLKPQLQEQAAGPWSYSYGGGNVEYQLYLTASSIEGQVIDDTSGVTYPADAKSITLTFEQKAGVLYTLAKGGFWSSSSSSDDDHQYPKVAALRAAHATIRTPLCIASFDVNALVYFDSVTHAAGFSYAVGVCNSIIKNTDEITAVESGVITLADRPVIALQIPNKFFSSEASSREKQILALVGLNSGGYAANGLAYMPGYTEAVTGYQNQAAFKAWLNTMTTDAEASVLP